MTVSEALAAYKRNTRDFPVALCGDCILGLNVNNLQNTDNYSAFSAGCCEIDAGVLSEIEKRKFVCGGSRVARIFAARKFTVIMDACPGDPVSDFLSSSSTVFGRENAAMSDYVFVNVLTGEKESGKAVIDVKTSFSGKPCECAVISADIYGFPDLEKEN